jgi:hypothetical protein
MNDKKKLIVAAGSLAFALVISAVLLVDSDGPQGSFATLATASELPTVTVYKSPQCGCCQMWADHMAEEGFKVKVKNVSNLRGTKAKYEIPPHLETCHTAVVGDYVVEGHVPASTVKRLLEEGPDLAGIVVPGMPKGSPGMEQGLPANYDRYRVLALGHDGTTAVYERH